MDVKNSPAGHVTEKCAIRQMSFSTDDNEYYELVHLFAPQNKQNPPASSGDEMKLKTAATKRLTKAKAGYTKAAQALIDAQITGKAQKTYNEVFGTNDPAAPNPVKTPEPKSSEAARTSASAATSEPPAKPQPQPGFFDGL